MRLTNVSLMSSAAGQNVTYHYRCDAIATTTMIQLSTICTCGVIKNSSKPIITAHEQQARLSSNRDLQRNIAQNHMVEGLHTCEVWNGIFVNPVFEVAHEKIVAIESSIAAETRRLINGYALSGVRFQTCG